MRPSRKAAALDAGSGVISSTRKPWLSNRARYSARLKKRLFSMRSEGDSEGSQDRQQGHANRGNVALAAAFGHEAAARLQRPVYAPENGIVIAHPVQCSIGKDGIEFLIEGQCFPARTAGVCSPFFGCGDHLR